MTPRVGVDLDNTIACYDELFWRLARARGAITDAVDKRKAAVRSHMLAAGRETEWTEIQAEAYGPEMPTATPFEGVRDALAALAERADLVIVSHRSPTPYRGPAYDLHAAARAWLANYRIAGDGGIVAEHRVFLEPERAAKIARIAALGCTHFIDDQAEILSDAEFPSGIVPIHFSPGGEPTPTLALRIESWRSGLPLILDRL